MARDSLVVLEERIVNSRSFAKRRTGEERDGWLQDAEEYEAIRAELTRLREQVREMATALDQLYTFPGVRDLLAPKESLGSIAFLVESSLAKYRKENP